ncbi:MAG: hypothetical protein RLY57_738 [Candidatus Parcubacteria bacterium]|jgi:hypothetical protein
MKQHLENLRAKPDSVKRRIAFFTSLGITLVILLFWVISFNIQTNSVSASTAQIDTPASSLTATVSDAWGVVKNIFVGSSSVKPANDAIEVSAGTN